MYLFVSLLRLLNPLLPLLAKRNEEEQEVESFNHLPIYYFVKKNLSSVNGPLVKVLLVNIKERNRKTGRGFGSKSSCDSQTNRNQIQKRSIQSMPQLV